MQKLIRLQLKYTDPSPVRLPESDTGPSVFIQTYGCQMNVADSQTVESLLMEANFRLTDDVRQADVVLVNTCMVRETAEVRALGQLANLSQLKRDKPQTIIGILGCVAQAKRREIFESHPFVDLVIGPDGYRKLPALLEERLASPPGAPGLLETTLMRDELYDEIQPRHGGRVTAFTTIIRGCDKFCSYCVVPRTRGRERSRPLPSILKEVRTMIEQGVRDVMLLGQNVDSYRWEDRTFANCLSAVAALDGIRRVRFMTSHPSDISDDLLDVMGTNDRVCPFLHLPVQAGNNRILKLMNRPYTREQYLGIIERAKRKIPGLALSTDIIVGFPSETEAEYGETLDLVREVRYDTAFTFKYSERPLTKAARLEDDVPEAEKVSRLERLIELQKQISRERNEAQIGRETAVLIEGQSPKDKTMWTGRTPDYRPVVVPRGSEAVGDEIPVRLTELRGFTFLGARLD